MWLPENYVLDVERWRAIFRTTEMLDMPSGHTYVASPHHGVVVSHFKDKNNNTIVIARVSEAEFLDHYNTTKNIINMEKEYDLLQVTGTLDIRIKILKEVTMYLDLPTVKPSNYTVSRPRRLVLGNSQHPIAIHGLFAKRFNDDDFWIIIEGRLVIITPTTVLIYPRGYALSEYRAAVLQPKPDRTVNRDPTDKYVGNAIMRLL